MVTLAQKQKVEKEFLMEVLTAEKDGELDNVVEKQVVVTDCYINNDDLCPLVLDCISDIITQKAFYCKVVMRNLIQIDRKNHSKYFAQTKDLLREMLKEDICEALKEQHYKQGLAIYIMNAGKSPQEQKELVSMFQELVCPDTREKMMTEWEQLKKFVNNHK